jgi:hypothetical protein
MAKRNYVQEVQSVKSRTEFNSRYDYKTRLDDIKTALEECISYNGNLNKELLKYVPIATVACFESFFRSAVKELVDFGKPFNENVAKFNQVNNVKFDFEVVAAIQTKTLAVGEFVAHFLSYNNYDDINSIVSTLSGVDFTTELKNYKKESVFDSVNEEIKEFTDNHVAIIASVKRTYELRHIFCHEFATNVELDEAQIINDFKNSRIFLEQSDKLIWSFMHPNLPETQADMYMQAGDEYEVVEKELNDIIFYIQSGSLEGIGVDFFDSNGFNHCMEKWKEYRIMHAEFAAKVFEGGSMAPTMYVSDMSATTREKVHSLRREFEYALRKTNYKPNLKV